MCTIIRVNVSLLPSLPLSLSLHELRPERGRRKVRKMHIWKWIDLNSIHIFTNVTFQTHIHQCDVIVCLCVRIQPGHTNMQLFYALHSEISGYT